MERAKTFKDILVTEDIDVMVRSSRIHQLDYMMLCLEGSAILQWDDKVLTMTQNNLMFSPAGRKLSIIDSSRDFRYRIFAADSKMLGDVLFACLREEPGWITKLKYILENPIIRLNDKKVEVIDSYRNLVRYYVSESGFYKKRIAFLQAQAIIFELLSWVDEAMTSHTQMKEEESASKPYDWYWKFRHLLNESFSKEHLVSWYAGKMQISPAYLHQICKQVCDMSPQQIINATLLKEAKRLLVISESSVKEIAYSLNFSSESNFCKFFKRMIKVTPATFRKNEKGH